MISGIVNKIKTGAEKLDNSISKRPWKSLWSVPKAVYGAAKYLIYHPTRLTIKGLPYAVNLEQTLKKNIRPKIPFGNPDVYFDVRENKTTNKDYGIRFDPIMKKKGHGEDVGVKVPRYKLPQRSMQQFEAWLESSEEDKKNKNFIPKSSDNKKLSDDEQKAYNGLIELYKFLKKNNGTVKVEGEVLVIRVSIANKTFEEIKEQVKHCCDVLGMPPDTKMIKTIAKRLYKKALDQAISSDETFAKTKQMPLESVTESSSHPALSPQSEGKDIDGEIIEEHLATQQDSNLGDTKDKEFKKQTPNVETKMQTGSSICNFNSSQNEETTKEESTAQKGKKMGNIINQTSQFSLTNPREFPNNVVSLQHKKDPDELQSDLVSRYQSSEVRRTDMNNISQVIGVTGEDLKGVFLSTTSTKPSCISRTSHRKGEEVSRG